MNLNASRYSTQQDRLRKSFIGTSEIIEWVPVILARSRILKRLRNVAGDLLG
jgi:hypothetical protein